jgi:hypothetical protein
MQMAKLSLCHFLASGHLIFKILVPTPVVNRELWGVGTRIMKIKCSEIKKWQKQTLAICIFAVTPFISPILHGSAILLVLQMWVAKEKILDNHHI